LIRIATLLVLSLTCFAPLARAQSTGSPAAPLATAVRVENDAIRLDGRMDEAVWASAPVISDFVQKEPVEGAAPSERTEVRFVYDDNALYVGARMHASGGRESIQAPLGRRDAGDLAEYILVSLDTYLDRRTAFSFGVTASGVRLDHFHRSDSERDIDRGFNPVWEARVSIDDDGWTAEMWIPFSQLRFANLPDQTWGLNVHRWIPSKNEDIYWVAVPRTEQAWASRFGTLEGIGRVGFTRRIEVLPYVVGGSTMNGRRDLGNPFDDGRNLERRFGGDLKMGLGPNLTLDATVLPDFGQVEADPAVINLSATETFYTERRPFFTEGVQLIGGGINNYFYSRRIGAPPQTLVSGDFVDYPQRTPILGAAKVTGRLPSGLSVGVLAAVTDEEHARTYRSADSRLDRVAVAPRSGWGIARLQQEVGSEGSMVSLMMAGVHRQIQPGSPLAALMNRNALTLAGESLWRLSRGTYEIGLSGGMSHVAGDEAAILRVQRASPRYFQRPDAPHLQVDPTLTSLTGYKATFQAQKVSGRHWLWDAFYDLETPGVEFNDIGRISFADGLQVRHSLTYRETRPGRFFRNYRFSATSLAEWTMGLEQRWNRLTINSGQTWNNFWSTSTSTEVSFRAQEWTLTRGGPLMQTPLGWTTTGRLQNSSASPTRLSGSLQYGRDELDGWNGRVEGSVSVVPDPRLQISLGPSLQREVDPRQYVATRPGGSPATYGGRYIFSYIDRTTLSMQARVNLTLRPDVDLNVYAQPFAASGRYYGFGELEAAGSRFLRTYGEQGTTVEVRPDRSRLVRDGADSFVLANRDFNVRSFRSTSVLRWEWRPGSTLYAVWQQDRSDREDLGERARVGDMFGSLGVIGNNYFAIKASYWLGL
jgi:hypothetical protein